MTPWVLCNDRQVRPLAWPEVARITRDICFLYHELVEYRSIMGDLNYAELYTLPYWEYLEIGDLPPAEADFIRDGSLVMMLAMAWDVIDGSGSYLLAEERLGKCLAAVRGLDDRQSHARDARAVKLVQIVRSTLESLTPDAVKSTDLLSEDADWVHREYVRGYFEERASGK